MKENNNNHKFTHFTCKNSKLSSHELVPNLDSQLLEQTLLCENTSPCESWLELMVSKVFSSLKDPVMTSSALCKGLFLQAHGAPGWLQVPQDIQIATING